MMISRISFLTCLAAFSTVCALAQSSGTLGGTISDTQGKALAGAEVRYQRVFRTMRGPNGQLYPAPGEAVVQARISADASGAFAASGLAAGDYLLCANVPSSTYLDSCEWGSPVKLTIPAATSSQPNIALAKGVFLKVHINDPLGLLPAVHSGPLGGDKLVVGVSFGGGAFTGATNTAIDSTGRDYQITVPVGTPLQVFLFSSDVALTDSAGKTVNAPDGVIPFQATAGQDQVFTFTAAKPQPPVGQ